MALELPVTALLVRRLICGGVFALGGSLQVLGFRLWFAILALAASCSASVQTSVSAPGSPVLAERERQAWKSLRRIAEFAEVPHTSLRGRCEASEPPQALATPEPMVSPSGFGQTVKVSFIVGTDGRVHSPLILRSGGALGDRSVLRTVRSWRYRPATCNGIPTEAEGKIEFSR